MRNASFTLDLLTLPKCWMTVRIASAAVGHSRPSFFRPDYRLCSLNVIICTWKAAGELGDFLHTVGHGLVQALALIFCSLFSQTVLLLLRLCTESLQPFAYLDPICFYFQCRCSFSQVNYRLLQSFSDL